ncbi:MAG: transketolase C-terminal domain-containing protein, partial [Parvularcula sp.]
EGVGVDLPENPAFLEIGKGRIISEGNKVALISYGGRLAETMKAADLLAAKGLSATVVDARFAKPLDEELIGRVAREHEAVLTIEEGSDGGFGAFVLHYLARSGMLDTGLKIRTLTLPDVYQDQGSPEEMYAEAKLTAVHIADAVAQMFGAQSMSADLRA